MIFNKAAGPRWPTPCATQITQPGRAATALKNEHVKPLGTGSNMVSPCLKNQQGGLIGAKWDI